MGTFETLADALDAQIAGTGSIGFIDGGQDERHLTYELLSQSALRVLAALQAAGAARGDPLILFVPDNLRFLQCFWAAVYGGIVPVPVAAGASDAHLDKLIRIWRHLDEPRLVTDSAHLERLRARLENTGEADAGARLAARSVADEPPAARAPAVRADDVTAQDTALIQFSSGSTGDPKGVVLSHANVLANIRAISRGSAFGADEIALSWMPLTHDMGLIGFHLTLVCNGYDHHLMATDLFARRPLLWLEKAHDKRATLLCSPNFGYRHTLRAIAAKGLPEVDLSAVRLIYNGAEPIAPALAREFVDALAPVGLAANSMFAVYGLAEASLAATFPAPGEGLRTLRVARGELGVGDAVRFDDRESALELVCLGAPVAGNALRIADGQGVALGDDVVGRVWLRGASVTAGYYANADANAAALVGDGWLDTGDLGFTHGGDLLIAGRAREIIFINGQNHYPQDLEAIAQGAAFVDLNKVAAVGVRGADTDELLLFVVFRGHAEDFMPIARDVAARINHHAGLAVARVLPVRRMPKTTSGKLQRARLAQAYADGEFDDIAARLERLVDHERDTRADHGDALVAALRAICDEVVPHKTIGRDDDLFEIGLSSLELAQIHEGIEQRWPDQLDMTDLFDYPTINDLAGFLEQRLAA